MSRLSFNSAGQFAWDSTSLGALKTCPRKYQLSILEGWTPRSQSLHLRFGIAYHKGLERYQQAEGTHDERICVALRAAVEVCTEPDGSIWETGDTAKSVSNLLRSIVWHCDQYKNDAAKTVILANGKPAVELSFRVPVTEDLIFCGHLDRLAEFAGSYWVVDYKTTKMQLGDSYFAQFEPNNQMSLYAGASKLILSEPAAGVLIDAAQFLVGGTRFGRSMTRRSEEAIEEFFDTAQHYISLAQVFHKRDFWPMNDMACGNYGGCAFRKVCSAPKSLQPMVLATNFDRTWWDPLVTREV
jgi:hypothetical protein